MPQFEFSPTAQHWVNVVLIWVGFGTLSGLVARVILPLPRPAGPAATIVLGTVGSAVGLLAVTLLLGTSLENPISPFGFLAAIAGAFGTLLAYQIARGISRNRGEDG
jgi:uncharacterized membrane protein YeaQ/YmgE (transglycosylase-associated protein family)